VTKDRPYAAVPRRAFLAAALGTAAAACTPGRPAPTGGGTTPASGPPTTPAGTTPTSPTETGSSTPTATRTPAGVAALRDALGDRLVLPGDARYAASARIFNPRFDGATPVAIAYCTSADEVRRCVDAARSAGVPPIARSGGHSYGGWSTGAGLVIDVTGIAGVTRTGGTAAVGGGARLIDVYDALGRHGVGIPAGSCPTVGVAGLALGGGLGIEGRQFGLTSDRMLAVDVVLASGDVVTATADSHADLMWASRGGGGGNFGIATRFVFETHATADLTRWQLRWPWASAADVLMGWTDWVPASPRELFTAANCASTVGVPRPAVSLFGVWRGPPAQARSLIDDVVRRIGAQPSATYLRTATHDDTVRSLAGCATLTDSQCASYSSGGGVPRQSYAVGSDMLRSPLTQAGAAAIVSALEDRQRRKLQTGSVLIDSLGGAIDDVAAEATAYAHRGALATVQSIANWDARDAPANAASNLAWLSATRTLLAPHVSGEAYVNYLDPSRADWESAYYGANGQRLAAVKRAYDPQQVFGFPQGVRI
jgi:FAD/FMN-containing dehydrogenase